MPTNTKISQMVSTAAVTAWSDGDGIEVSTGLSATPTTQGITKSRIRKDLFTIGGVVPAHGDTIIRNVSETAADSDWVLKKPSSGWRSIDSAFFTTAPPTTSTITCSVTSDFAIGIPVRVKQSGVFTYGIVTGISTDASITIAGAPLTVSPAVIQELSVGVPGLVTQLHIPLTSSVGYGTSNDTNNLSLLGKGVVLKWNKAPAFLVRFSVVDSLAGGAAGVRKANVLIAGSPVGTDNTNTGPFISTAAGPIWTDTGAVAISPTNYSIAFGEAIELSVIRDNNAATLGYLNVLCTFVFA